MAPKRKPLSPLNDPPPIESEEDQEPSHEQQQEDDDEDDNEEGETDSSDDQEEEDDEEQEKYRLSRAVQPAPKIPSSSKPHSSSSDSESDTESDSEPETPAPTPTPNSKVKPLASKPKEQAPKVKQAHSSSSAATQVKSASKRPAENNVRSPDPKQVKKKKVTEDALASEDGEGAKKSSHDDSKKLSQRLFSDEDEIAILQGMVEFRSATGGDDPYRCAEAFHEFMTKRSKRLSFDASSGQLKEKIRRMKTKFIKNACKGDNGEAPRFSKPHEQRAFELSQAVWGESAEGARGVVSNGALEKAKHDNGKAGKKISNLKKEITTENAEKPKPNPEAAKAKLELQMPSANPKEIVKIVEICEKSRGLSSLIKYDKGLGEYGLGEDLLRKGDELMEASKRAEFEAEWTKLEADEMELRVKRAELYADHAKSMFEAITSSRKLA